MTGLRQNAKRGDKEKENDRKVLLGLETQRTTKLLMDRGAKKLRSILDYHRKL